MTRLLCGGRGDAVIDAVVSQLQSGRGQGDRAKGSARVKDLNSRRILDAETRRKRQKRQLESLEKDNFHDDPHAQLNNSLFAKAKIPAFDDNIEVKKKKKARVGDIFKQKAKRSFAALLEEAQQGREDGVPDYFSAVVPPSHLPERHFCAVCGCFSNYTCITCGTRYCCVKCLKTHQDTRCLKWIA